jgi:hypothetical protein
MGCEKWGADLTDWALDELSPLKAQQLEQHLEQCMECARSAQQLRGLQQGLMSSLTDREMPAHLVLVGEKPQQAFAGLWTALLRWATLSAAAAAVFLTVVSAGLRYGGSWLFPASAQVGPAVTRTELRAFVAQAVAEQASLQRKETQAATEELAVSLRQEQMRDLARIAQQLQYVELAQNAVWKETQQQNEVISLVAHNHLQSSTNSPTGPAQR